MWLQKYPAIDGRVTDRLRGLHGEVGVSVGGEAQVLAAVLAASTQTAFSDVMWSHVLYSLDTLPASTVTAVLRHALPLLSSTDYKTMAFAGQGEGVMASHVPVTHRGDLMGTWEQLCRWVRGKKRGWCLETKRQEREKREPARRRLSQPATVCSLLAFMEEDACEEYCLYHVNGRVEVVASYNMGRVFKYNQVPGDVFTCSREDIGISHSAAFYLDSRGVHCLKDNNNLDVRVSEAMQGDGLRGRRAVR